MYVLDVDGGPTGGGEATVMGKSFLRHYFTFLVDCKLVGNTDRCHRCKSNFWKDVKSKGEHPAHFDFFVVCFLDHRHVGWGNCRLMVST